MARISLKCDCGWAFFVPGSTQGHEAPCPNCGQSVDIPGRSASDGPARSPGAIAAEHQARQKKTVLLISAGVVAALALVAFLLLGSGAPPPEEPAAPPRRSIADKPQPHSSIPSSGTSSAAAPTERKPLAPSREGRISDLRQSIRSTSALLNLAGVTVVSLRLRGHAEAAAQLETRMATWEATIASSLAGLVELEDRFVPDPYVRVGDRLVGFSLKDVSAMKPSELDLQLLSPWLRGLRVGQPVDQIVVLRGADRVEVYAHFPEVTDVMQGVARLPDITGPGAYNDPPPPALTSAAPGVLTGGIPDILLKDLQTRFAALPAGYKESLPAADRRRMDELAAAKMGSQDDVAFLSLKIQAEVLPAFEREAVTVRSRAAQLEPKLKETTAVDVVHFKDGRKVTGQVLEDTAEHVKIKSRLGSMTLPRADVSRIERGKGGGLEFGGRLAACPRTVPELAKLLAWCQEGSLKTEGEYVGLLIVALDPRHEPARKAAQLSPRPPLK